MEWLGENTDARVLGHPDVAHFSDANLRPDEIMAARRRRAGAEGVPEDKLFFFEDVREETEGVDAFVPVDAPLRERDVVTSVHGDWQVLETPGHCPSHICLHQPESQMVVVGDLLSQEFHPWFDYGYSSEPLQETVDSLRRLRGLGELSLVLPGHGRSLEDVDNLLDMHITELEANLAAVRAAVGSGTETSYDITHELFGDDLGKNEEVTRFVEVVTYLAHERRSRRIKRTVGEDGIYRHRVTAANG